MKKLSAIIIAIFILFTPIPLSNTYSSNNKSVVTDTTNLILETSTLKQSINNLENLRNDVNSADKPYFTEVKGNKLRDNMSQNFVINPQESIVLFAKNYDSTSMISLSEHENLFALPGVAKLDLGSETCEDQFLFDNKYQLAQCVDLSKQLTQLRNNRDYKGIVIKLYNRSNETVSITPSTKINSEKTYKLVIEPKPLSSLSKAMFPPVSVVDNVSLINDNGQVTTYPYPSQRFDVCKLHTENPLSDVEARTFISYDFGTLLNATVTNSFVSFSGISSSCSSNKIEISDVGRSWTGQSMTWQNMPQGTLLGDTTYTNGSYQDYDVENIVTLAVANSNTGIGLGFAQTMVTQDFCSQNQTLPALVIEYKINIPNESLLAYVDANWSDGRQGNDLGKEHQTFYEEILQNLVWLNTSNLNMIYQYSEFSVPVKGSSALSMNFQLTYNSQSFIDTGVGWGFVHNYQVRFAPYGEEGDLIYRGATGTLTIFKLDPNTVIPSRKWVSETGHLVAEEFLDDQYQPWLRLSHKDGTKIEFKLAGEYIPVKYLDCQGRYFYIEYLPNGKINRVRNDYGNRNLTFTYVNDYLTEVRDITTNPTIFSIDYSQTPTGTKVLSGYKRDMVTLASNIVYCICGEMKFPIQNYEIKYLDNAPGVVEFTPEFVVENQTEGVFEWHWRLPTVKDCTSLYQAFTTRTDEPQERWAYGYQGNPLHKVVKVCGPTLLVCTPIDIVTYTYNEKGDIANILKAGETYGTTYTYDYEMPTPTTNTGQVVKVQYDAQLNQPRPEESYLYADQCANMVYSKNRDGIETTYEYYSNGLIQKVNHPNGDIKETLYDGSNQPIKLRSTSCGSGPIETDITYDASGKPSSITYPTGETTNFTYDQKERLSAVTGSYPSNFSYDNKGRLSTVVEGPTGNQVTSTYNYDSKDRLTSFTRDNKTTSYDYFDSSGLLKKTTSPDNKETNIYYNEDSSVKKIVHPGARAEEWGTDEYGRINSYTPPDGHTITYGFRDGDGRINRVTWEDGYYMTVAYDSQFRPTRITDPDGNHQDRTYIGTTTQIQTFTDEMGKETEYHYDTAGRIDKITAPNDAETTFEYNPCGLTEVTNDANNSYSFTYDDAGRILTVTDAKGKTWAYEYTDGDFTKKTDPKNNETTYTYDTQHRPTNTYWPGVTEPETSVYSITGLKTSFENGENETMQFSYDSLYRLSQVTHSDSSTYTYAFDATTGDMTSITEPLGTHTFAYQANGELDNYTSPFNWQVDYTIGDGGLLTSKTNNRGTYNYAYTNRALTAFQSPELGSYAAYTYNASGYLTQKTVPATQTITYDYTLDNLYKATAVSVNYGSTDKYDWSYTYNDIGLRTQMIDAQGTHTYQYDAMGQITQAVDASITTNLTYDDNYNVSSKTVGSVTTDFTYNASDQLTNTDDGTNSTDFVYDDAGRMTSYGPHQIFLLSQDGTMSPYYFNQKTRDENTETKPNDFDISPELNYSTSQEVPHPYRSSTLSPFSTLITLPTGWTDFEYDDKGNVTLVTKPNNDTIEFKYYATGKRAKKIVTVGSTVTTYKYHWDGDLPVKIEKTIGETTTSTYFTFRKPGDLLTMTVGEDTYFFIQNIRGDITAILDSQGNQVASYTYDTWGVPTISNPNNLPNPFLYQGSYATFYDDEFQMYGMGARHYNPTTMRFISRDLNHGTLTNTMSQNLYIYCYNNPLGFKDPSGFSPYDDLQSWASRKWEFYSNKPNPNSTTDINEQKRSAAYEAWLKATGQSRSGAAWTEFLNLWNQAGKIAEKMKQYDDPNLNQYDQEIAFWTCYWNDKASLGLVVNGDSTKLIEFANVIKAISFMESTCGQNQEAVTEGMMGIQDGNYSYVKDWLTPGYNEKLSVKTLEGINAGLYVGIAFYLRTMATMTDGIGEANSSFDKFSKIDKSGMFVEKYYKLGARAFGGDNLFVKRYYKTVDPYNNKIAELPADWTTDNPYGTAVWDIATKGAYNKYQNDSTANYYNDGPTRYKKLMSRLP